MGKALIAIDKSKMYRVYLTISTDMVEEARKIHNTTPLATAGLGRVLTGAGLMGLMLKGQRDKLTLSFTGDGPARQILATADAAGNVKGYIANPDVDLPLTEAGKLDVGGSLGVGDLKVIKDLGLKEPYMGSIALVSGEIADDLTAYFFISEQQNSSVALGVKVARDLSVLCSGGMIIQMLPGFEEEAVDALEEMLDKMKPLTTLIEEVLLQAAGKTEEGLLEALMAYIFKDMPEKYRPETLEFREIKWNCDCSEERLEQALMTIGRKDLTEILEEDGQAELVCQFCEKKYFFDKKHLEEILSRM
ncbi:Hsp33 family molecular chaperone HslO [Aminipila luticellarii]|uniref:33 kDa chaperonin n=1 Tax=Aminipila luticellarii TaxID=2507160 RepID=A0A410PSL3_9FIRM|nr:Hsp33 family molecular chaperone HslO [Aminipila luticellarii]QAT41879.1 Hsp33 family molecular chaperone HslO [Aminipila luticellarii]